MSWVITGREAGSLGLLDQYAGAAAAYSLRSLTLYYTGPVVRVRRSSDNTESDFTATQVSNGSLATWVGAGNNGFVRTWYDQSGNSAHAGQVTTAAQPILISNGSFVLINNKPAIEFDGSNDLLVASPQLTAAPQSITVVSVHNAKINPAIGEAPFSFALSSSRGGGIIFQQNGGLQPAFPRSDYPLNQTLLFYDQDTVNDLFALNGTSISLVQVSSTVNTYSGNLDIGRRNSGSLYMDHYEQELIIYSSSQRASRGQIEANINAHYAIY